MFDTYCTPPNEDMGFPILFNSFLWWKFPPTKKKTKQNKTKKQKTHTTNKKQKQKQTNKTKTKTNKKQSFIAVRVKKTWKFPFFYSFLSWKLLKIKKKKISESIMMIIIIIATRHISTLKRALKAQNIKINIKSTCSETT